MVRIFTKFVSCFAMILSLLHPLTFIFYGSFNYLFLGGRNNFFLDMNKDEKQYFNNLHMGYDIKKMCMGEIEYNWIDSIFYMDIIISVFLFCSSQFMLSNISFYKKIIYL
jgi:hypothetical protein